MATEFKTPGLLDSYASAGAIDTSADSIMVWDQSDGVTKLSTWAVASQALVDQNVTSFNTANGVTVVPSTVTDGAGLQTLIDARQTAGGGVVYLPDGRSLTTTQKITVPDKVTLQLSDSAEIVINSDVDGIELRGATLSGNGYGGGSKLIGGRIRVTQASYTKAAILLDGERSTGDRFNRFGCVRLRDVTVEGQSYGTPSGIGVHIKAHSTASHGAAVQWVDFQGLNIFSFEDGVLLDAQDSNSQTCFINGNTFSGIFFENCVNFWRFNCDGSGTPNINLNSFQNTTYQVSTQCEKFVVTSGSKRERAVRQQFTNANLFDWTIAPAADPIAVDLGAAYGWTFYGIGGLTLAEIDADFDTNVFVLNIPNQSHLRLAHVTGTNMPGNGSTYPERLQFWSDTTNKRLGLLYSDGTTWRPILGTSATRVDYTASRTLTTLDLISCQLFAQGTSAVADAQSNTSNVFDIGTNAFIGCEVHIQRRHASVPLRLNGGSVVFYDPFAGTNSTSGQYLSLDTQYAEVVLRCLDGKNWGVVFKRGTLSYVAA